MTDRQRLPWCLALSVSLHFGLALLVGSATAGAGSAGEIASVQQPAAHPALSVVISQRSASERPAPASEPEIAAASKAATPDAAEQIDVIAHRPNTEIPGSSPWQAPLTIAAPYYFKASELDRRPQVVSDVQPEFPATDFIAVSGSVVLRLLLDEAGSVDRIQVERSELPNAFQESAVAAFSKATFAPGEVDNFAVKSELRIEVTFDSGA